jgi:hypothetical protein
MYIYTLTWDDRDYSNLKAIIELQKSLPDLKPPAFKAFKAKLATKKKPSKTKASDSNKDSSKA